LRSAHRVGARTILNPWESGVWYLTIGLTAAVLVRLSLDGLLKIYKLLYGYLALSLVTSLAALTIPYRSNAYGYLYFSSETSRLVIAALVVVEIYSLALENTPALARFGRNTVGYILAAAAIIPAIALLMDNSGSGTPYPYLRLFYLFEQTLNGTIAIFLLLISLFMAWFPVRLRRNVIAYIGGFIVWTLTRSASAHFANEFPKNVLANRTINSVSMCVAVGCLIFWLVVLKREGEARTAVVGHLWNRAEAERLTQQLDAINNGLTRLRRGREN
jgi:hypothetical protein